MEDKKVKRKFTDQEIQELRFTKEDRNKVFKQLYNTDEEPTLQKKRFFAVSKLVPLTVSLLLVSLCIFLFLPSILQGNVINKDNATTINGVLPQNERDFTALFTVKDENDRIPINLILTYSKDKKMMKVLSIPRDTYAPIVDKAGNVSYDKLTFAYANGSNRAENVKTTVSTLFDLPIDYYAVMDLESFSAWIDLMDGIDYDLQEDTKVRAISKVAYEFKKGTNRFDGEEVAALLIDATTGKSLGKEDLLNLLNIVMVKSINEIPEAQLKEITSKIEGNIPFVQLIDKDMEIQSLESVSLVDGINDIMINQTYYIKFEKDFLHAVSEELTTFD